MVEGLRHPLHWPCRALLRCTLALLLGLAVAPMPVRAASPVDLFEFASEEQQARYRGLIAELRCPKCLNTNLAGSDAPIAQDLRRTVYRLMTQEGMSDAQIRAYLQARYGDFVLYDPPFRPDTWILWLAPALFAVVGALVVWRMLRRSAAAPLSADEQAELRGILDRD